MVSLPVRVAWIAPAVAVFCFCSAASAQPRPYLFAMGRYTAVWAGRPWSYDEQCWDHMVNIGATMNGSGLCWCDGEPTQGTYNWDAIAYADFAVDEMIARGIEPTFFLGLTPAWAALHPELPPHQTPPSEDYIEEFMDFHRFVANRYKDKVKYYYFWNEPNGCSWINEGCANSDGYPLYTQWLIRCSQAVKEMDPDAKIIAGNLDYNAGVTHGYEYVQGMYDCGAGPHIDGIAIHPYDWAGTIYWQALTDTRNVMVANGDADKPIWITEFGWNYGNEQDLANRLTYVLTELKEPEWGYVQMACYLVLNDGSGVENYGLMDADLNPRLRYYAFQALDKTTFPEYAEFSADATEGIVPLTVQFTDESYVIGAHTWYWQFGDNQTSGDQHPAHEYTAVGTYTVRLTVTGDHGAFIKEKPAYIEVLVEPPPCSVQNPSFETNDGSLDGWKIVKITTTGPDDPPLDNSNPFGVVTPFGTHFGGKITNGNQRDFYMGQVICVLGADEDSTSADWQLNAWVQLRCTNGGTGEGDPNPTGVHQVWEIGWNDDGSVPTGIMDCDNYQLIASIDGNYTGNDRSFHLLGRSGAVSDVTGLEAVVFRAHLYNDAAWWWTFMNMDNVDLVIRSAEPCSSADLNQSGEVNGLDLSLFVPCLSGANVPQSDPACENTDRDQDGDVDQSDFGLFQRCFSD